MCSNNGATQRKKNTFPERVLKTQACSWDIFRNPEMRTSECPFTRIPLWEFAGTPEYRPKAGLGPSVFRTGLQKSFWEPLRKFVFEYRYDKKVFWEPLRHFFLRSVATIVFVVTVLKICFCRNGSQFFLCRNGSQSFFVVAIAMVFAKACRKQFDFTHHVMFWRHGTSRKSRAKRHQNLILLRRLVTR